jgi:oxygen-independent coproporphyrinogen-3 oxidase
VAGIYIHIPFCRQACHYCDFHFSTSMKNRDAMVNALLAEIALRRAEAAESIETIYFGGGTPSVLPMREIDRLVDAVYQHYDIAQNPEITLEANPDDLSADSIVELSKSRVNRLSIGIQSFFDDDLRLMNRAHNADEAKKALALASRYFDNISIDLIYGIPGMTDERWLQNIHTALSFHVPHISSYALTVEPKTALRKMIEAGKAAAPEDALAAVHFNTLVDVLETAGFVHYELSNFGKPGFFSRNNSAYWLGKKYIGIGPSAHSYDGASRSWNVAGNNVYIKSLAEGKRPYGAETLSATDRYNEYVMTGLRTVWGVSLSKIEADFGAGFASHLIRASEKFRTQGLLSLENDVLRTTPKGKFLADGLASDLFLVN